ncbi:Udp-Galnac:Beta-1,3-N-Acetylgalactosaminyltransferase 1 [Manis pentadactyla]|nr:Udp-Galnac:Beta-1,3-N-Acetylgalactosaminyltransferase 1 [Manis pentadactyla]
MAAEACLPRLNASEQCDSLNPQSQLDEDLLTFEGSFLFGVGLPELVILWTDNPVKKKRQEARRPTWEFRLKLSWDSLEKRNN